MSPDGARALFAAHGDIFSAETSRPAVRDMTATPAADEDHPAWSPDGRWIAYSTDANGNQQIALRRSAGGPERILTTFGSGYFYRPVFSPDGRNISVSDGQHRLWQIAVDSGATRQVAEDKRAEIHDQAFSPDGRWLAFSLSGAGLRRDLYLYEIASGRTTRIGAGQSTDANPAWSSDGRYLFFTSHRHESAVPSDLEDDFAVLKSTGVYVIALARDTPSPVAPRLEGVLPQDVPPVASRPSRIDLEGLMDRAVALPIAPDEITQMDVRGERIFYLTQPVQTVSGAFKDGRSGLHVFDLGSRKSSLLAEDLDSYSLSQDGTTALIKRADQYLTLDTRKSALLGAEGAKPLDLDGMRLVVDSKAEWSEMFFNSWRLERDLFFSPAMNGQDWEAVRQRYARLLPLVGSREDLNWLIGEVLGELGSSHTYVAGGDDGDHSPKVRPALLGADWAVDPASGRYRLARIYPGDNTRSAYRSPLAQPGLAVKEGDYVLAIGGAELRAPDSPDRLLQDFDADKPLELTLADSPSGTPRTVLVQPVRSEIRLREAAWIAGNRQLVDRLSGGRVGYIYLSDMGPLGLSQFLRDFYSQMDKQALVVDDRWNGGGSVASAILERLRRRLVALRTGREGGVDTEPQDLSEGPKVMLVNHWAGSNGDMFPYLFRQYGLGQLVGTRTWGGVRGNRTRWPLMDGGYVTVPERAPYNLKGEWILENHGVDPDLLVEDQPPDLLAGHDVQLESAVELMLKALRERPATLRAPPPPSQVYPASGTVSPEPG